MLTLSLHFNVVQDPDLWNGTPLIRVALSTSINPGQELVFPHRPAQRLVSKVIPLLSSSPENDESCPVPVFIIALDSG